LRYEVYCGQAKALENMDRHKEAIPAWEKALTLAPPENQPWARLRLGAALAHLGDHARAMRQLKEANETFTEKTHGILRYQAALVCSVAARAAGTDRLLSEPDRQQKTASYLDEAVRQLNTANARVVLKQPSWASKIQSHPDWEPVRSHKEGAKILHQLTPAKP